MKKITLKKDNIYMSKLLLKFTNLFIYTNLKKKVEKKIYISFFFWKKQFNYNPLFFFFESLLKLRPILGFYIYIVKKKKIKKIKIKQFFMKFNNRWKKAIYWISRSIKIIKNDITFAIAITNELYNISILNGGQALLQKSKHYKALTVHKTSKNLRW